MSEPVSLFSPLSEVGRSLPGSNILLRMHYLSRVAGKLGLESYDMTDSSFSVPVGHCSCSIWNGECIFPLVSPSESIILVLRSSYTEIPVDISPVI